ncbi:aspartyl protease family protein [Carboxylicivirga caseinilyticus]|uniref:retropepsin-like aspartic protease n=1 Tax=Carboxylicivirga caseinilyticus TaxID=3417572 RepID=UPI003D330E7F|nr:aspartyl protease family protein [Marinilabiliaceae bacterium A049]
MKQIVILILIQVVTCSLSIAQSKFTFNQGQISKEQFYQILPIEYLRNKIIIQADVDGIKGRYIVDTGAMCIVFKDSTKEQNHQNLLKMPIVDANGIRNEADVIQIKEIRLGELEYHNIPALSIEAHELFKCFNVKGFIGSNLLRFGAFKIDIPSKELHIADSYSDFDLKKKEGQKLWLNKVQNSPFIRMEFNGVQQQGVLVDTGSDCIYSFNNKVVQRMQKKGLLNKPAFQSSGTNSQGAWSMDSMDIKSNIWRVNKLKVADSEFTDLLLRSDDASSRIGMQLLENGVFVLDYPKKRFFFQSIDKIKSEVRGFGIDFIAKNDSIIVNGIWSGTKAEKEGVQIGDRLIEITGFQLRDSDLCDKFFLLKQLALGKDELEFVMRRKDSDDEYSVTLQRIE